MGRDVLETANTKVSHLVTSIQMNTTTSQTRTRTEKSRRSHCCAGIVDVLFT